MEISIEAPQKLKIELPYNPSVPLLGIYPKESKSAHNRDTYTLRFITTLFTIAKLWNQPRCPSTDEWRKKMWYIHTMEYYSVIKNEIISFGGEWIELNIMLSKINQTQKEKYHVSSHTQKLELKKKWT
jgi:hypothetical protein